MADEFGKTERTAEAINDLSDAVVEVFRSPKVSDDNFEAANIFDALTFVARGLHDVARAIREHGGRGAPDELEESRPCPECASAMGPEWAFEVCRSCGAAACRHGAARSECNECAVESDRECDTKRENG